MPTSRPPRSWAHPRTCRLAATGLVVALVAATTVRGQAPSPPAVEAAERLELETTDGVALAAWLYRAPGEAPGAATGAARSRPAARTTVVVLHDLGGSHASVESLALTLQRAGIHVVVPDLRGHGASTVRSVAGGKEVDLESKNLKRIDLEAIAASTGGTVRDQATARGDIETIRAHLRSQSQPGGPGLDRLVVVGFGTGATLAALWTAADASWPPLASGAQGRQVAALVLVSPAWAPKGLPILPALGQDALKRDIPILVIGGRGDKDALRVFDQVKRHRPQAWYEQRAGQQAVLAPKMEKAVDATAVLFQLDTDESGEKLLAVRRPDPVDLMRGFLGAVLSVDRPAARP